jgi:hypothetical protein
MAIIVGPRIASGLCQASRISKQRRVKPAAWGPCEACSRGSIPTPFTIHKRRVFAERRRGRTRGWGGPRVSRPRHRTPSIVAARRITGLKPVSSPARSANTLPAVMGNEARDYGRSWVVLLLVVVVELAYSARILDGAAYSCRYHRDLRLSSSDVFLSTRPRVCSKQWSIPELFNGCP